jgi:hypothetical protein
VRVLWRAAFAVATVAVRRNKDVWSSLGLGLSLALPSDILGDSLGDIISKYDAILRE